MESLEVVIPILTRRKKVEKTEVQERTEIPQQINIQKTGESQVTMEKKCHWSKQLVGNLIINQRQCSLARKTKALGSPALGRALN
jgi:hypothetical protein